MSLISLFAAFWRIIGKSDQKRIADQTPTPGVTSLSDIAYIDDGTREHLLDVYYPSSTQKKLPVIIDIHGGGWMYGYKEINKNYNLYLASAGYTVFSINYRLVPEVHMHQQLQDVFAALKWIDENLESYPCERENVFLTGDSAGGQLAAYAAAIQNSPVLAQAYSTLPNNLVFNALCLTCPACDMLKSGLSGVYSRRMLEKNFKSKPYGKYLTLKSLLEVSTLPPTFLISSTGDFIAKGQTKRAAKLIEASGAPYKFMYWKRSQHKLLMHVFNVTNPEMTESIKATDSMLLFFEKYSANTGEKHLPD